MPGMMDGTAGELDRVLEDEDTVLASLDSVSEAAEKGAEVMVVMQGLMGTRDPDGMAEAGIARKSAVKYAELIAGSAGKAVEPADRAGILITYIATGASGGVKEQVNAKVIAQKNGIEELISAGALAVQKLGGIALRNVGSDVVSEVQDIFTRIDLTCGVAEARTSEIITICSELQGRLR